VEAEMNERLRELADQARFAKTADYPNQDEVFERFAKLIVKECIKSFTFELEKLVADLKAQLRDLDK
jgi:hypothetical protein